MKAQIGLQFEKYNPERETGLTTTGEIFVVQGSIDHRQRCPIGSGKVKNGIQKSAGDLIGRAPQYFSFLEGAVTKTGEIIGVQVLIRVGSVTRM